MDLNNLKDPGWYALGNTVGRLNIPTETAGILVVSAVPPFIYQEYTLVNNTEAQWHRTTSTNGASWTNWTRTPYRSEFDALNNRLGVQTLASLGITTPCVVRDIVNALPYGCNCVISITEGNVTDLPVTGELYICKASASNVVHKTDLLCRSNTSGQTTLPGKYMVGLLPGSGNSVWYDVSLTARTFE